MAKNSPNIEIAFERIANVKDDVATLEAGTKESLKEIRVKIKDEYVTFTRYNPVEKIVYSMVSVILLTVLGAGLALIVGKAK